MYGAHIWFLVLMSCFLDALQGITAQDCQFSYIYIRKLNVINTASCNFLGSHLSMELVQRLQLVDLSSDQVYNCIYQMDGVSYYELSVIHKNKGMLHLTPINRLLQSHGKEVECSNFLLPVYQVLFLLENENPTLLTYIKYNMSFVNLATAGINIQNDLEKLKKQILFPSISKIADQHKLNGITLEENRIKKLFSDSTIFYFNILENLKIFLINKNNSSYQNFWKIDDSHQL